MSLAMESFARNSLAQFIKLYSELVDDGESGGVAELERKMWAKVTGGALRGNRIPWSIVKKEVKIQLPYLPEVINYSLGCQALKKADGLYIPCGGKCAEGNLCQSCAKTGCKYGQIEDRGAPGSYMDPEDKHEITYGTWLAKKEKTIEDVNTAITDAGFEFTIPASYLAVNAKRVEAKKRPGRPGVKKEVVESDDDSVSSSISSKSSKSDKPKATKAKSTDSEKPKPKAKKAQKAETSDDEDEKPKTKPKAKKAETSDDEDEKPKTKPKAKKSETSDDEKPKAKPKAKKAETSDDEKPKAKPKAKKAETSDEEPKKAKAEPKKKADPKKKPEPEPEPEDNGQLEMDDFENEMTEELVENIEIDGISYVLKEGRLVFNLEGEWVGNIEGEEFVARE